MATVSTSMYIHPDTPDILVPQDIFVGEGESVSVSRSEAGAMVASGSVSGLLSWQMGQDMRAC